MHLFSLCIAITIFFFEFDFVRVFFFLLFFVEVTLKNVNKLNTLSFVNENNLNELRRISTFGERTRSNNNNNTITWIRKVRKKLTKRRRDEQKKIIYLVSSNVVASKSSEGKKTYIHFINTHAHTLLTVSCIFVSSLSTVYRYLSIHMDLFFFLHRYSNEVYYSNIIFFKVEPGRRNKSFDSEFVFFCHSLQNFNYFLRVPSNDFFVSIFSTLRKFTFTKIAVKKHSMVKSTNETKYEVSSCVLNPMRIDCAGVIDDWMQALNK